MLCIESMISLTRPATLRFAFMFSILRIFSFGGGRQPTGSGEQPHIASLESALSFVFCLFQPSIGPCWQLPRRHKIDISTLATVSHTT